LLEHAPNCGAFVKKFSRQEIWELFELREVLEGYAAARAATRLGPEQLEEMQHLCDEMLRMCRMLRDHKRPNFTDEERRRFSLTDATFHRKVIGACGNERVKRLVEDFGLISKLCNRKWPSSPSSEFNNACWTWGAHARILRSLKKHDGEGARRWMSDHINRGEAGAMELYDDPVEPTMIPSARTISSKDQLSVRYRKGAR
jgi:DNA-binding GntR family transcriptional regulator